jgi:hypothetical protein
MYIKAIVAQSFWDAEGDHGQGESALIERDLNRLFLRPMGSMAIN